MATPRVPPPPGKTIPQAGVFRNTNRYVGITPATVGRNKANVGSARAGDATFRNVPRVIG